MRMTDVDEEIDESQLWREHREEMQSMRRRRRLQFERVLDELRRRGHEVKQMTLYQLRVDDCLDLYPSNKRWHDVRNNRRGDLRLPLDKVADFVEGLLERDW